jgi:hypothetical protein
MFRRFRPASQDYVPPAPVVETRGWTPAVIVPAVLLMVLGAWVFAAPLVGPYFSFGFDTSSRWRFTSDHWLLSLVPGIALFGAGLLMTVRSRAMGWLAGLVAVAAGVWLVIGPTLHSTWRARDLPRRAGPGPARAPRCADGHRPAGSSGCPSGAGSGGAAAPGRGRGDDGLRPQLVEASGDSPRTCGDCPQSV